MQRTFSSIALLALSLAAQAADKPASIKLCYDSEDSYPWTMKDRPGADSLMLKQVEQKLGVKIEQMPLPWKRCLDEMRGGQVDGAFAASFKTERMELGAYPMAGDRPDSSKQMHIDSYSLFRLKGGNVDWDGSKLQNVSGAIGAQSGYSIVDQLKGMGVRVDDGTRSADDNLRKLMTGRVAAVALQTREGDNSLHAAPDMAAKIEKVPTPLVEKPYYLMLSKQLVGKYGDFSKEIWKAVAEVRESADYKAKLRAFK